MLPSQRIPSVPLAKVLFKHFFPFFGSCNVGPAAKLASGLATREPQPIATHIAPPKIPTPVTLTHLVKSGKAMIKLDVIGEHKNKKNASLTSPV